MGPCPPWKAPSLCQCSLRWKSVEKMAADVLGKEKGISIDIWLVLPISSCHLCVCPWRVNHDIILTSFIYFNAFPLWTCYKEMIFNGTPITQTVRDFWDLPRRVETLLSKMYLTRIKRITMKKRSAVAKGWVVWVCTKGRPARVFWGEMELFCVLILVADTQICTCY